MTIARRVVLLCAIAITLLACVAAAVTAVRRGVESSLQEDGERLALQRVWEAAVTETADVTRNRIRAALAGSEMVDAMAALDGLADLGLREVTVYDTFGELALVWPPGAPPTRIDQRRVSQLISGRHGFHAIAATPAGLGLMVAGAGAEDSAAPGFVAVLPLTSVLAQVVRSWGVAGFIVDPAGRPLLSEGGVDWAEVAAGYDARAGAIFEVVHAQQAVQGVTVPLRQPGGQPLAHVVVLRDRTLMVRWLDVMDGLSLTLILAVCVTLVVVIRWFVVRTLGPLAPAVAALSQLSRGSTSVEVPGDERADEMGEMARSIKVFRDRVRRLRDGEEQRLRQWTRQQDFIRAQLQQMANTLSPEGRESLLADLARIERMAGGDGGRPGHGGDRALAAAVEVMAERVGDQHRRLEGLVTELRAALETKTELFQLQQQVEVARRMQQSMLPRGLLPRPTMDVGGTLVPAAEFDGAFYDYFWLPDGRLAVTLGQPAAGGLAGGFLSATARASLRALLSAGMAPGQCLERTRLLLRGEQDGDAYAVLAAVLDPAAASITWAGHGFAAPMAVRRLGDAVDLRRSGGDEAAESDDGEADFDLSRGAAVVFLSSGMVPVQGTAAHARVDAALRAADDPSPAGLLAALRAEGLLETAAGANLRDRACVVARFLA